MDYKAYYINQVGGSYPVFSGNLYQKGFGLGNAFTRFFKWVMPILKKNALPVAKTVGRELVKGASNVALDTLDGRKFEDSASNRLSETIGNIKDKVQAGNGKKSKRKSYKRKRDLKDFLFSVKKTKKYKPDIFRKWVL